MSNHPILSEGYLRVEEDQYLYYQHCGHKNGITILFLHGGPGLGTKEEDKLFFDLNKVNLILFDQRGAGKSRPKGVIKQNTPQHIVQDIIQLLDHLNIQQVILFGGSWGAALSLLFGIEHPHRVKGMILRGIFTASTTERKFFEQGAVQLFFPKIWNRFLGKVPKQYKDAPASFYFQHILSNHSTIGDDLSYELILYGLLLSRKTPLDLKTAEIVVKKSDYKTRARLLSHFSSNNFFLPDQYILDNLDKISTLPIRIVQGRYDMITPPKTAIELAERLYQTSIQLVDAGHSPNELVTQRALQMEVNQLVTTISINDTNFP